MADIFCKFCGAENPESHVTNAPYTDTYTYECVNCSAENTYKSPLMEILETIPISKLQIESPFSKRIMGAYTH